MNKYVLILSGSPGKNGNSGMLCDAFMKGALEAGHQVQKIRVAEKNIGFCRGCYGCKSGACVLKDDMAGVYEMGKSMA